MNETLKLIITIFLTGGITTGLFWIIVKKLGDTFIQASIQASLKKYEQYLDKQKLAYEIQYTRKTTKETEAIQHIYENFSKLLIYIFREVFSEDKIFRTSDTKVWDTLSQVKKLRNSFIDSYEPNKIYLPKQLCEKIDTSCSTIDEFITLYDEGVPFKSRLEYTSATIMLEEETNIITGLWESAKLDISRQELEKIKNEIENEFRKVYN